MTEAEIGKILFALGVLIAAAHLLGYIFDRLKQPRLIGEILAGVLVGPFVLGQLFPSVFETFFAFNPSADTHASVVFSFLYWMGIIFLMFLSGTQVRDLLSRENRRSTAFILGLGKPVAFLIVIGLAMTVIPMHRIMGSQQAELSTILILACAVAVTSIPVISRIFQDLGIMETRFAGLVLGIAVLEDIAIWAVLAIATSYAQTADEPLSTIVTHTMLSLTYLVIGLTLLPKLQSLVRRQKWNILIQISPVAYALVVLSLYIGLAAIMEVNLIFAAFLAGFGLVGGKRGAERKHFTDTLAVLQKFSFAVFIPVYFALVGYRLVFNDEFSFAMLGLFLVGSSLIAVVCVGLSARLAGHNKSDTLNLAITLNARGGPGIVLASIAFDAGIINAAFYTTLVLTALLTSQFAGAWLRRELRLGKPLLASKRTAS